MTIENWLHKLSEYSNLQLILLFLTENFLIIVLAVFFGKYIEPENTKVRKSDIKWIVSTLTCNTIITMIGFKLYCFNILKFNFNESIYQIIIDILLLVFIIDFIMFWSHFLAHKLNFFYSIHKHHHNHVSTSVYSLFILHPIETIGFGVILISIITLFHFNFYSITVYLILNISYGVLGHLKTDLFPKFWNNFLVTKFITNTKFHNKHHIDESANFGFYFTIWDMFIKTYNKQK